MKEDLLKTKRIVNFTMPDESVVLNLVFCGDKKGCHREDDTENGGWK